jgi:hypothetical protein
VKHFAHPDFWACYRHLPETVRELADKNFQIMKADPSHPSIRLKKAGNYWSARIGLRYRALAFERSEGLVWFWIGSHSEYDKLLS